MSEMTPESLIEWVIYFIVSIILSPILILGMEQIWEMGVSIAQTGTSYIYGIGATIIGFFLIYGLLCLYISHVLSERIPV